MSMMRHLISDRILNERIVFFFEFQASRLHVLPVCRGFNAKYMNRYVCSTASFTELVSLDALRVVVASVALARV